MRLLLIMIIICNVLVAMERPEKEYESQESEIEIVMPADKHIPVEMTEKQLEEEEERMCNFILTAYFHSTQISIHLITRHLKEKIRNARLSKLENEQLALEALTDLFDGNFVGSSKKLSALQFLVMYATANALEEKNNETLFHMQEAEKRWCKRNVAIITAITGIASTLITAIISIIISYT